jgi:FMN phosphatase YigB (HAD superfamily)
METIRVIFFDLGETLAAKNRQWIPGAKATLSDLRARGILLGIISNTGDLERSEILKLLPIDFDIDVFDQELVIFSSEAHVEKPDLEIFRLALSKTGAQGQECLFCTEDLVDTLDAQRVGFRTARIMPPPATDIADLIENMIKAGLLN